MVLATNFESWETPEKKLRGADSWAREWKKKFTSPFWCGGDTVQLSCNWPIYLMVFFVKREKPIFEPGNHEIANTVKVWCDKKSDGRFGLSDKKIIYMRMIFWLWNTISPEKFVRFRSVFRKFAFQINKKKVFKNFPPAHNLWCTYGIPMV